MRKRIGLRTSKNQEIETRSNKKERRKMKDKRKNRKQRKKEKRKRELVPQACTNRLFPSLPLKNLTLCQKQRKGFL